MKNIGIVVKADPQVSRKADDLERWLRERKVQTLRKESTPPQRGMLTGDRNAPADLFCILVLGGDGTFLSAVRWIGDQRIPILGVKFGEVGFLAEIAEDRLYEVLESILNNTFHTQPRMRLLVQVIRKDRQRATETVLNDVVINKGALARLASIDTSIDGRYLTTYRADGLIVATPTGSTAYSLAAGGPVLHPGVPAIVMTPICPFTLTNRPLIIPDASTITINLEKRSADIMLTFDGQQGMEIDDKDTIIVQKGPHPIYMISEPNKHYYDVLKAKLRWSGGKV
ncbi:MAG: inorganic polyphosphate kinase [Deltaproteobacteria bacterium SG8_13]|nr:MAG: inorganic polyphosphate kinase [Deltaproteobacteria bacterium SG8_13]